MNIDNLVGKASIKTGVTSRIQPMITHPLHTAATSGQFVGLNLRGAESRGDLTKPLEHPSWLLVPPP